MIPYVNVYLLAWPWIQGDFKIRLLQIRGDRQLQMRLLLLHATYTVKVDMQGNTVVMGILSEYLVI